MMMAWKVSGLSQSPAIMASRPASMRDRLVELNNKRSPSGLGGGREMFDTPMADRGGKPNVL
jgi:hypothetical protein